MRYVAWPYLLNTIDWYIYFEVLLVLLTFITFPGMTRSKIKRFWLLLTYVIIFIFFINAMLIGLLWNVMPLSLNWPKKIQFELYPLANAMFWRSIWPDLRSMEIIPTCFICITYLATVTKSIYIDHSSLNNFLLLQRYHKVHKSRYYIPTIFSINSNSGSGNLLTIIILATSPEMKNLRFESLSWAVIWWVFLSGLGLFWGILNCSDSDSF